MIELIFLPLCLAEYKTSDGKIVILSLLSQNIIEV